MGYDVKLYREADKSFTINFGSKRLRPIRIKLPDPPPIKLIDGYGEHPDNQFFKRMEIPFKLKRLEDESYDAFKNKASTNWDVINYFWDRIRAEPKIYEQEIDFIKKFIWHMHYGYWFFNDGQPTYITGWHFSYLNLHYMTLSRGEGYPEYRDRGRLRFLFRKYIYECTETFWDLDGDGNAIKVDGKYRMKDVDKRLFFGTIEPKGRREGLTNEFCHIITRIMSHTRGSDNIGTIVSMDGNNAEAHFKQKLLPAFKRWPIWLKPIWKGGATDIIFDLPKTETDPRIKRLGSNINYTESGGDLANDGKKIMAAGYDEQGKGKRFGNAGTRWQVNKETMSLGAGSDILGFCIHPSTVEKMEEGGQDYKEMCDMSDFYHRQDSGQTISGLALSYMPSSYGMEGYVDKFGKAVLKLPNPRQIRLGYKNELGSRYMILRKRKDLFVLDDPKKMDEYRSFVRKFPEDYDDCWRGVSGYLGYDIEAIESRIAELEDNQETVRGRFEWVGGARFTIVEFIEDNEGPWEVALVMKQSEANLKTSMEYYSAYHDAVVPMFRPLIPNRFIMGLDPHEFLNKGDSVQLKSKFTKLSDTGISILQRRRKDIDKDDNDRSNWKTRKTVACLEKRFPNSEAIAEEAIKAAIYYGALIHLERNKSEVWSLIIKWNYGGYLNHSAEVLPDGAVQIDRNPGVYSLSNSKKKMFSLGKDQLDYNLKVEPMKKILWQAKTISSMEEMTKFDIFTAWLLSLHGAESIYADIMVSQDTYEEVEIVGMKSYNY